MPGDREVAALKLVLRQVHVDRRTMTVYGHACARFFILMQAYVACQGGKSAAVIS